jgi:hypothetical protein
MRCSSLPTPALCGRSPSRPGPWPTSTSRRWTPCGRWESTSASGRPPWRSRTAPPFEQDRQHAAYDPEYARRFWRILVQADRVLKEFRGRYLGKASPVHFFWGSCDLAVTRFSGRPAPEHPGGPNVARFVMVEAYSHEVSSCGFWPGAGLGLPAFYAYAYPEPEGFPQYPIQPAEAYYHPDIHEFILPYDALRTTASPDEMLLAFCQSTYEAAAVPAKWNRPALERGRTTHRRTISVSS